MNGIRVLTPTGTLGYGFGAEALKRGMELGVDVIAVDAGSTDPGPYYLGSGKSLVSDFTIRKEMEQLIAQSHKFGVPLIVGSAGGAGSKAHVERLADIVRHICAQEGYKVRLATIYSDIPKERVLQAVKEGEIINFEAPTALTEEAVNQSSVIVAQMGHEPICKALDDGADIIITGRACDDSVIAAYPIWKGADPGLSIHMGKILECGSISAEPFAMDVMLGTVYNDYFELEPGSIDRRASIRSVAAHSLYERENPFTQGGPGHEIDLSGCHFESSGPRTVIVKGAKLKTTDEFYVKLEGARLAGQRATMIAGVRCPSLVAALSGILKDIEAETYAHFADEKLMITVRQYGDNGVMGDLENSPQKSKEIGVVVDVVAENEEIALAACHQFSGALLHRHFDGVVNPSGNLAFPYSPSDFPSGAVYEFSAYHLLKARSPLELFPAKLEDL